MRLQLRSSLVKPAKKVIGKQRLTVLVNVSFPAPKLKGKLRLPFFLGRSGCEVVNVSVACVEVLLRLRCPDACLAAGAPMVKLVDTADLKSAAS